MHRQTMFQRHLFDVIVAQFSARRDGPHSTTLQPVRQAMQIGRETIELAYRFQISIRTHRHIMGSVTYVNPSGLRVNHVQPRVIGLQPSCPFLLLFASTPPPVDSHSGSPSWENGIRFGPVTIRLRNLSIGVN